MAKINRLSGIVSGRMGDDVYYGRNGEQEVRRVSRKHKVKNTARFIEIKTIVGEISSIWRELPEDIKAIWEKYAKNLGSPSEVERNDNVTYRLCPIPNYPPRPKNISGVHAFISANCRGHYAGMELPLLAPPLGILVPPPAGIDCIYDRPSGELVVKLQTPKIAGADSMKVRKAFIWITAFMNRGGRRISIVQKHLLDVFDIPAAADQIIERRYSGIKDTGKAYRYKPLLFKDLPYLRIYIGAQVIVAPDGETAPVVSCGSYLPYWMLNKPKYIGLEDLLLAGELKQPGRIKFSERFKRYAEAKRRKLAKKQFMVR